MEFAITAQEIGHDVTLFEKSGELGGTLAWAGNYRTLRNMEQIAYQTDWHRLMIAKTGVKVRLNEPLTTETAVVEQADVVVVATGAELVLPYAPGLAEAFHGGLARTIDDVLRRGPETVADGPVVVWGAGEGIELALDLARAGRAVRLLDPNEKFVPAAYIGSRARYVMIWAGQAGLTPEVGILLEQVRDGAIVIRHADGREEIISCSALVVAPARRGYDPLSRSLQGKGIEVHTIGDARSPRSYGNAIHEAAYLARRI